MVSSEVLRRAVTCSAASPSLPFVGSAIRCPGGSGSIESSLQFVCNRPTSPNQAHLSEHHTSCVGALLQSPVLTRSRAAKHLHHDSLRLGFLRGRNAGLVQQGVGRRISTLGLQDAAAALESTVLWHWNDLRPVRPNKEEDPSPEGREGPSCIYVGPVETAAKADLEALYQQARDEYYSGRPLIVDEMFDKIERRLRWFGSKLVLKYPRCSLRRYSAYSDAELDRSQLVALGAVWSTILAGGVGLAVAPPVSLAHGALRNALLSHRGEWDVHMAAYSPMTVNGVMFVAAAMLLGSTVATAAVRSLRGLVDGGVVALKGSCPACSEEVYAFIRADESQRPRHKCECHVCEQPLVFHATLEEESAAQPKKKWAYGRIYLVVRATDLAPSRGLPED